jgi:hypothetical protein
MTRPVRTNHACPRCGWSNTRRSQLAGSMDRVFAVCLLVPVRCRSCRHRFFRFRNPWLKYLLAIGLLGLVALAVVVARSGVPVRPPVFSRL